MKARDYAGEKGMNDISVQIADPLKRGRLLKDEKSNKSVLSFFLSRR